MYFNVLLVSYCDVNHLCSPLSGADPTIVFLCVCCFKVFCVAVLPLAFVQCMLRTPDVELW